MKTKIKQDKAITLIALIITIIVMLILVGVVVSVVINSNLLGTAKSAVDQTKAAYDEEAEYGDKITVDGKRYANINDYLNNVEMVCEHEFGEEITKEATCEEAGKVYRVCKLCEYEHTIRETALATGHNFNGSGVCENCGGYKVEYDLTGIKESARPQVIEKEGTTIKFEVSDEEHILPTDITVEGASKNWNKATGTLEISNPTGAVNITIKAESIIGVYVEYDYLYDDVYQTDPQLSFTKTNGWRYLGKEAGTGNIMLISTGIPVNLEYYGWSTYGWMDDNTSLNMNQRAANGLKNSTKFAEITFEDGTTKGSDFIVGRNAVGVRTLTIEELNLAVNKINGNTARALDSSLAGFKGITGTAVGLFDMQKLDGYSAGYKYWLASPSKSKDSTRDARCLWFVVNTTDTLNYQGGVSRNKFGVRPVILLSGVKLKAPTEEETCWTLEEIN